MAGDPYGGSLHCEGGLLQGKSGLLQCDCVLLQGETCGFVFRHSAISGLSPWSSLLVNVTQGA